MANVNCEACSEIRTIDPNLMVNGWTETECTSFKNDTGLNPSSGHNDCTDLELMNDCLIGNLDAEVDAYEVCDWKPFMHKFIPNLWTVISAIKCALCGLWTNVHNLWNVLNSILSDINKFRCYINFIMGDQDISAFIDESNFVAGTDVNFDRQDDKAILPSVIISGSTYTISGSIRVHLTNNHWNKLGLDNDGDKVSGNKLNTPNGNYTLCIVKIPKAQFPWIKGLQSCVGSFINAGISELFIQVRDEGTQYPGQWGNSESGLVTVPAGQIHIRVALAGLTTWGIEHGASDDYADVTFRATGLAMTNPNGIDC